MGRKRTQLDMSEAERAQLQGLLRTATGSRTRERIQVALWAASGRHTLEDLAKRTHRARATIQNWLAKFHTDGVTGLLTRDTPPGSTSPIAKRRVQRQLQAGLEAGRWQSAQAVSDWLAEVHGVKRSRKSIYYWLTKLGVRGGARATSAQGTGSNAAPRI